MFRNSSIISKIRMKLKPPCLSLSSAVDGEMSERTLALAKGVLNYDRTALAQSITLIESSNEMHKRQAELLLNYIEKNKNPTSQRGFGGKGTPTFRIGFAGPPGAGKSTFIEAFGKFLIEGKLAHNNCESITSDSMSEPKLRKKLTGYKSKQSPTPYYHNIAVLPVDPSSQISGGSILGDKTRMEYLMNRPSDMQKCLISDDPNDHSCTYIRASPTRGVLGGIAEYTTDVITLCEASGYDTILVESVGVGQNEIEVDEVVDCFILVVNPGGGDDLQASKKGIMESADIIIVNKTDGDMIPLALHTKADYSSSLKYIRNKNNNYKHWNRKILCTSSTDNTGFDELYDILMEFYSSRCEQIAGNCQVEENSDKLKTYLDLKRNSQDMYWMWHQFSRQLVYNIEKTYRNSKNNLNSTCSDEMSSVLGAKVVKQTREMEKLIKRKEMTARGAASTLLDIVLKS